MDINRMFRSIFKQKEEAPLGFEENGQGGNGHEQDMLLHIPDEKSAHTLEHTEKLLEPKAEPVELLQMDLVRYSMGAYDMLGKLYFNGHFQCFTLEGNVQGYEQPAYLPEGLYEVELSPQGGKNATYAFRYRTMHKGMLRIRRGDNFPYALIHEGNRFTDRPGSILLGTIPVHEEEIAMRRELWFSDEAYVKVYPKLAEHLQKGGRVQLWIREELQALLPKSEAAA